MVAFDLPGVIDAPGLRLAEPTLSTRPATGRFGLEYEQAKRRLVYGPPADWAETCAHVLLVQDAVETAQSWGLSLSSPVANAQSSADLLL